MPYNLTIVIHVTLVMSYRMKLNTTNQVKILYLILCLVSFLYSINFFSGNYFLFNHLNYHVLQSLSMVHGHLHLPLNPVSHIENDLQYYNGALFSNWGFGIPILQLPFQVVLNQIYPNRFFPGILIFIFYFLLTANLIWNFTKSKITKNNLNVLIVSFITLCLTTLWLSSYRFLIYEETALYFALFTINTFIFYTLTLENSSKRNIFFLTINLIFLVLIRPTGLIIAFLIWVDFLIKKRQIIISYSFLSFFVLLVFSFFSYIKSGSFLSSGMENTNPGSNYQLPLVRMGQECPLSIKNFFLNAINYLNALLITEPKNFYGCYRLEFEDSIAIHKPYIPYILSLATVILFFLVARQKDFKNLFLPFVGFTIFFIIFTIQGFGFAYRYLVDFYFFFFCAIYLLYVYLYKKNIIKFNFLKNILIQILIVSSFINLIVIVNLQKSSVHFDTTPLNITGLTWSFNDTFPQKRSCKDNKLNEHDKYGWHENCQAPNFINTYISLPSNAKDKKYRLFLSGENVPEVISIRFNGKVYSGFNWHTDHIYVKKPYTNNFNIFIKFKNSNNQPLIKEIYFK
jgi:hypothetical protein